jgi:hypothetical protein
VALLAQAAPPPPPPRSCAAAERNGVSLFGVPPPYAIIHCTNISVCCATCQANGTGCGAYFAKVRPGPDRMAALPTGSNLDECHLYTPAAAARLHKGDCPRHSGPKHECGSQVWVSPVPTPPGPPPFPPPPPPAPPPRPDVVELRVNGTTAWTISPYLASMSLVYSWAPDYLYNTTINGSITRWAKRHRINIARYPAGQDSLWDWEKPSGYMGISAYDPARPGKEDWNGVQAPPQNWMSLGEYLELCREIGSQPLIGVNYFCSSNHLPYCGTLNQSIAHAVKQVQFVVDHGFKGAFYYIVSVWFVFRRHPCLLYYMFLRVQGNEECQTNCAGFHADLIAQHAKAMKATDPTIKTFFSSNEIRPRILESVMKQVGVG